MKNFSIIVASTQKRGIGSKGKLPWPKIKGDIKFFQNITTEAAPNKINAVIMGRKTWESINKPLSKRFNIVLTNEIKNLDCLDENLKIFHSLKEALEFVSTSPLIDKIFVIGGELVYAKALELQECCTIYLTQILKDFSADTFFPRISDSFELTNQSEVFIEQNIPYQFLTYTRKSEELQYIESVRKILYLGEERKDRTGVGTLSIFGTHMKFNLRNNQFPLLTTKTVFWKGVVEELLWMIKGSTDSEILSKKGIKMWNPNSSREFLDKMGFQNREVGDLGPIYGFQWRHFGAFYQNHKTDYKTEGIDQLKNIIELIKKDSNSRRIILCSWNASQIHQMCLPPCHVLAQFYVVNGFLSCQLYQRSADMGLGVPFNIAGYSLLTYILAHLCHLKPGDFIHTIGDAHIYLNHLNALKTQITRQPKPFPSLSISDRVKDIDDITPTDILLSNYHAHKTIQMEMAV